MTHMVDELLSPMNEVLSPMNEVLSPMNQVRTPMNELREIHESIATLLAAKDEKDAHGETERYRELKRNAWGNVRRAAKVLPGLIERVVELENAHHGSEKRHD